MCLFPDIKGTKVFNNEEVSTAWVRVPNTYRRMVLPRMLSCDLVDPGARLPSCSTTYVAFDRTSVCCFINGDYFILNSLLCV